MYNISRQDQTLYEDGFLSLQGVQQAYAKQDPKLAEYVIKLVMIDPMPYHNGQWLSDYSTFRKEYHKNAKNYEVLRNITPDFREAKKPHQYWRKQKAQFFTNKMDQFIAEHPHAVPERLKMGEFMLVLYDDPSDYAQQQLQEIVKYVPLKWGPWQAFKYILKRGIIDQKYSLFAIVQDRWNKAGVYQKIQTPKIGISQQLRGAIQNTTSIDAFLPQKVDNQFWNRIGHTTNNTNIIEITPETRVFLPRLLDHSYRAHFQYLPIIAKEELLTQVLLVMDSFGYDNIWYQWANYQLSWTSSATPLLTLWQQARCAQVKDWAFGKLMQLHKSSLVNLDPNWIVSNGLNRNSPRNIREFIRSWIVDPITTIPKASFIEHNLHTVVLTFLDTEYGALESKFVTYACDFIRQFYDAMLSSIPLTKVLWLLRHTDKKIHELGLFLLFPDGEKKSPYMNDLTLEFWTDLLEDDRMFEYAKETIQKSFSKELLTLEWIRLRLLSSKKQVRNLAYEWVSLGIHKSGIDWYAVYYEFIFQQPENSHLYTWAWDNVKKENKEGKRLMDAFTDNDYRKLLVGGDRNRAVAIDAFTNSRIAKNVFPIDFMKHFLHQDDYKQHEWKQYIQGVVSTSSSLPSSLAVFASNLISNSLDVSVQTLGYQWVLDRRNSNNKVHGFVKKLFQDSFPNYALLLLDRNTTVQQLQNTPEGNQAGVEYIWKLMDTGFPYNNTESQFWKSFLLRRLARKYEIEKQECPVSSECLVSPDMFSLEWFMKHMDTSNTHRAFLLEMAHMYLTDWVAKFEKHTLLGFTSIQPLLFSQHANISQFFFQVIENPTSKYATIDIMSPSFTSEELFLYCYSSSDIVRETGLRFILAKPEKFAQPDKLIELASSPDPKIRTLVVEILFKIANLPLVTPEWQPHEDSVIPGNSKKTGRNKVLVSRSNPDAYASTSYKYLGKGTPVNLVPNLTEYDKLISFAKMQLFRLPPKIKPGQQTRSTKETWIIKKLLMISFRDLAIQDRQFAEHIIPIFQELTKFQGIRIQEQAWAALAHIEKHYAHEPFACLTAFDSVTVSTPTPAK